MVENLSAQKSVSLNSVLAIVVYMDAFMWPVGVVPTLYYAFSNRILPTPVGIKLLK